MPPFNVPDPKALVAEILAALKQTDVWKWAEHQMATEQARDRYADRTADHDTDLPPEIEQEDDWAEPGEDADYYRPASDEEEDGGEYLDPDAYAQDMRDTEARHAAARRTYARYREQLARRPRLRG